MKTIKLFWLLNLFDAALMAAPHVSAQVSYDRILNAADDPENWLTYNGGYSSQRYSRLDQLTPEDGLSLICIELLGCFDGVETNCLVC